MDKDAKEALASLIGIIFLPLFIAFVGFGLYFIVAFAMWLTTDPLDLIQDPVVEKSWMCDYLEDTSEGVGFGCGTDECIDKYKIYE